MLNRLLIVAVLGCGNASAHDAAQGWADMAGLRFSSARPAFLEAVQRSPEDSRNKLGLALALWAGQPTRGPDHTRAIALLREVAMDTSSPELAAAASFIHARAIWLGGDGRTAARMLDEMILTLNSRWAEEAVVARIQLAIANRDEAELRALVARAPAWEAEMKDPVARLGLHTAMAEIYLTILGDKQQGVGHLEAAIGENASGMRVTANLLLSAGRLLGSHAPERAAHYLRRFLAENPLDGRSELAKSALADIESPIEGRP